MNTFNFFSLPLILSVCSMCSIPFSMACLFHDTWKGYQEERERIFSFNEANKI